MVVLTENAIKIDVALYSQDKFVEKKIFEENKYVILGCDIIVKDYYGMTPNSNTKEIVLTPQTPLIFLYKPDVQMKLYMTEKLKIKPRNINEPRYEELDSMYQPFVFETKF